MDNNFPGQGFDNSLEPPVAPPSPVPAGPPVDPAFMPPHPPSPPTPQFERGGMVGAFFKDVTVTDVLMVALTVTGLVLTIKYYRDRIKNEKEINRQMNEEMQEIKEKIDVYLQQ